jgi:glycosyltransferase involved in cell wall biosynthesis
MVGASVQPLPDDRVKGRPVRAGEPRRTRVVVMIDTLARPGGGERLAVENAIGLDPARYERTLCITRWDDALEQAEPAASILARLREAGVRVIRLRRRSRWTLWDWWPLLKILRRERVDVLHGHLFGSNVWAAIVGRLARVPVVVAHEHMWAYGGNRLRPFLDRNLIARWSDAFVAVSEEGRRRMVESERIDPTDIVVIANGIAGFEPGDRSQMRAELGIPLDAPVVGSVGHLRPEKAFEVLVEAVSIARDSHPGLIALIAGEGPLRADLEAQSARLGVEGAVRFLGARNDVPDLLAALDVAVCCSDFEGGPLSVMEYMEAGLPVVATRVGGLPELVRDGESGLLVPPRDPRALAEAIARVLDDPSLRAGMGARGRELQDELGGLEGWISRIEGLYGALLGEQTGAAPRQALA